jgi:hypothetical protein
MVGSALALIVILVLVIINPRRMNVTLPELLWVILLALNAAFAGLFVSYRLNNEFLESSIQTLLFQRDRPIHPCITWMGEETYG